MMASPPSPEDITLDQFNHYLSLYPNSIERHYSTKIKDEKKRVEALSRDRWRYEELPASLAGKGSKHESPPMTLANLEKLVQWKM
jgi:hypothetical protein